jgi:hypothetical protein
VERRGGGVKKRENISVEVTAMMQFFTVTAGIPIRRSCYALGFPQLLSFKEREISMHFIGSLK